MPSLYYITRLSFQSCTIYSVHLPVYYHRVFQLMSTLKSLFSQTTNICFRDNDPAWLQATLPVHAGGLGIRSVVHLAPSAFLASTDGASDLVHQLLLLDY